jgi:hypothetical protein
MTLKKSQNLNQSQNVNFRQKKSETFLYLVILSPRSEKKHDKIPRWLPLGAKCSQSFKNNFAPSGSHLGIFSYFFSERGRQNYHICKVLEVFLQN